MVGSSLYKIKSHDPFVAVLKDEYWLCKVANEILITIGY